MVCIIFLIHEVHWPKDNLCLLKISTENNRVLQRTWYNENIQKSLVPKLKNILYQKDI